ncbi:hypothetical protein G7067_13420 [Leucobacter insecticola]|uniref:Uncharacterized protein n=1 Tax=Leucobacter insecticola TaxID=2714934 RepID=A0A6G8FLF7_9MICO|nr:DUF6264 family protein [Leucobacter insecticola]QIM17184.1 hypothetical protein G7067_13420 [Leucobacter insecticola]
MSDQQNDSPAADETGEASGTPDASQATEPAKAPVTSEVPQAPAARPRPAFGEYAPEGWEWKPEGADGPAAGGAGSIPSQIPFPASSTTTSARVAGVPHNLGVGSNGTGSQQAAAPLQQPQRSNSSGEPEPYRATVVPGTTTAPATPVTPAYTGQPGQFLQAEAPKSRTADRVITILLLGLGALGALITANTMLLLGSSYTQIADALDIENFKLPDWMDTFCTVSAIAFIALFAVVLIFSIQRMRARKLAFWVPLVAGVLALVAMFVLMSIVLAGLPELTNSLNEPGALQKLLEYMATM